MLQIIILAIVGLLGIWLGQFLARKRREHSVSQKSDNNNSKQGEDFNTVNQDAEEEKEERKKKILKLFEEQDRVANNDVEKLLDVSDATATNYLDELEEEGAIVQRGREGRGVFYERK